MPEIRGKPDLRTNMPMEDILMEELNVAGATFEDELTSTHLQDLRPGRDTNNGIDVCLIAVNLML